ncbi:heme ABC exporter ATP-binding protein CcmA [Antarcticirhabdus aurantiaca]|uniref:Heme ABC exporter ATP-binding protein CcmA n=1 Tax=Antarcticirhabdus aurantiaca TaxID=2606717 RepID=A0ACD4NQ80_9HYPH|nr:heme ABC exporter ATP-binding protein CcmA [Antarcticirhabdus aurantiaca]WAJ29080.1 heme ABC exporter ATP-binding protein CcmA [Jeongeuplla avenae]
MTALRVRIEGLVCGRGGVAAAGPVDADLAAGDALVVSGPNGAGKSTLLRTLAGLLRPLAGRICVSGMVMADDEAPLGLFEIAHYFGHRNALKPAATVAANLGFWQRFLGEPGMSVGEALARVGLEGVGDLPAGRLSAGQARRAAFARLLVARRPVWILDEPTTSLDAASQERMSEILATHRAGGGILVAATHLALGLTGASELRLAGAPLSAPPGLDLDEAALARAEGWL